MLTRAQPKFCKTQSVPYAMRGKVEEELERLVSKDIIEPVQFADWVAPNCAHSEERWKVPPNLR